MAVGRDSSGLPVVEWQETSDGVPTKRRCTVQADDGKLLFVHEWKPEPTLWHKQEGLLLSGAVVSGPVLLMLGAAVEMASGSPVLTAVAALAGAAVAATAVLRIAKRRQERELAKAWQRAAAPWLALQSFVVTDSQRYLGAASQTQGGRRIEPESVLFADFGSVASSIVVSRAMTTEEAAAEWHRLFTRVFINERGEHLRRLKAEAVQAQRAKDAERPSEI